MMNFNVEFQKIEPGKFPQVKFQINPTFDAQVGAAFLNEKKGGVNFGNTIKSEYPELTSGNVQKFVEVYYDAHQAEIQEASNSFEQVWGKVNASFFNATNIVFDCHQWPSGGYICFTSIFNCNPRFLDTKTFMAYFRKGDEAKTLIAHEMLHFMFYDWLEKTAPEYAKDLGDDKVWALSEIFDQLAFEQPEYAQIQSSNSVGYPDLQQLSDKIREGMNSGSFTMKRFLEVAKNLV